MNDNHKYNKDAASRCADSMNIILQYQLDNPDEYFIIDSDMFFINKYDINKFQNYDMAIILQNRFNNNININYIWNGIYYMNFNKLKYKEMMNWNCIPNTDVGGMMYQWLLKYNNYNNFPDTKIIRYEYHKVNHSNNIFYIHHLWSLTWNKHNKDVNIEEKIPNEILDIIQKDPRNINNLYFMELYDNSILHYRAGGNWNNEGMQFHYELSDKLKKVIIKE